MSTLRYLLKQKSESLYSKFNNIIEILDNKYLKHATLPYYTSHGIDHSESIEKTFDDLISDEVKEKMNDAELFVLLCSAYFHDIGMAVKIDEADAQKSDESKEEYERRLDIIRRTHSERAFRFIMEKYRKFTLDKGSAFVIAEICKAHSDIKYTDGRPREYTFTEILKKNPVRTIGKYDVRVHFLAALIRIADELDLDYLRSMDDFSDIRDMPETSKREQMKHQLISGIKVDSMNFKMFIDIFEDDLYQGENLTADKNEGLTEVVVKLRKALLEVVKPLNENNLMYKQVGFRDPAILKLQEDLENKFGIGKNSHVIFDDRDYKGAMLNVLLFSLECTDLSPEYIVSNNIDFLFSEPDNFIKNSDLTFNKYQTQKITSGAIDSVKIRLLKYLNEIAYLPVSDEEISKTDKLAENYKKIITILAEEIVKKQEEKEFIRDLSVYIHKMLERLNNGDLKRTFYIEGLREELLEIIIRDIYIYLRRKNYEKKCTNHFIYVVFSSDFFLNIHKEILRKNISREEGLEILKSKLMKIQELLEKQKYKNFRFYYHTNSLSSESKVISAELAIVNSVSTDSVMVINDVNGVIDYYSKSIDLLKHRDTWRLKSIDMKNLKFKFNKDDEYYRDNKQYKDFFIKQSEDSVQRYLKNF